MFRKKLLGVTLGLLSAITIGGAFLINDSQSTSDFSKSDYITVVSNKGNIVSKNGLDYESPILKNGSFDVSQLDLLSNIDDYYTSQGYAFSHYNINTAEDLVKFSSLVNKGQVSTNDIFVLTNDIDLSGVYLAPIGTKTNPFNATFLGNGHTISNITILDSMLDTSLSGTANVGLFGYIKGATIMELNLGGTFVADVSSGKTLNYGTFVGYSEQNNEENDEIANEVIKLDDSKITNFAIKQGNSTIATKKQIGFACEGFRVFYCDNTEKNSITVGLGESNIVYCSYNKYIPDTFASNASGEEKIDVNPITLFWAGNGSPTSKQNVIYNLGSYQNNIESSKFSTIFCYNNTKDNLLSSSYVSVSSMGTSIEHQEGIFFTAIPSSFLGIFNGESERVGDGNLYHIKWKAQSYNFTLKHNADFDSQADINISIDAENSISDYYLGRVNKFIRDKNVPIESVIGSTTVDPSYWGQIIKDLYSPYGSYDKIEQINDTSLNYSFTTDKTSFKDYIEFLKTYTYITDENNYDFTRTGSGILATSQWCSPKVMFRIGGNVTSISNDINIYESGKSFYASQTVYDKNGSEGKVTWVVTAKDKSGNEVTIDNPLTSKDMGSQYYVFFSFAPSLESLKYYYDISVKVENFEINGHEASYENNKSYHYCFLTTDFAESREWNSKVWNVGTPEYVIDSESGKLVNQVDLTFKKDVTDALTYDIAWDNYYRDNTNDCDYEPFPYDDTREFTIFQITLMQNRAKVVVNYVDESGNKLNLNGEEQVSTSINKVSFESSLENTQVPLKASSDGKDEIIVGSNAYYYPLKFMVQIGSEASESNCYASANLNGGAYTGDFLGDDNSFDGTVSTTTYVTIVLAKVYYAYAMNIYGLEQITYTGQSLNEYNGLFTITKEHIDANGNSVAGKVENGVTKFPWGTTLNATIKFTSLANNLYKLSGALIECFGGANLLSSNFDQSTLTLTLNVKLDVAEYSETNQKIDISLYQRSLKILLNKYSFAGNEQTIDYTNKLLLGYTFSLSANSGDTITYENIVLNKSNHVELSPYTSFDYSSGLPLSEKYYLEKITCEGGNFENVSDISTSELIKEAFAVYGNSNTFDSSNGYDVLLYAVAEVKQRQINYQIDFSISDLAPIMKNGVELGGVKDYLTGGYGESVTLPVYTWTGHNITNFKVGFGANRQLLSSDYQASGSEAFTLTNAEARSLFSGILGSDTNGYYGYWTSSASGEQKEKTALISVVWSRLSYAVKIDDSVTINLQIGDKISLKNYGSGYNWANTADRNGQARYIVERSNIAGEIESFEQNGEKAQGYNITGFRFNKSASENYVDISYNESLTFDKTFIESLGESYFISSLREKASYKVYVRTSSYYSVSFDSTKLDLTKGYGDVFKINGLGGEDSQGVFVYGQIGEALPIKTDFTLGGAIIITRDGYAFNGFSGQTNVSSDLILSDLTTSDNSYIKPIFERTGFTNDELQNALTWSTQAGNYLQTSDGADGIAKGQSYLQVYALANFDIIESSITGSLLQSQNPSKEASLTNGDKVSGQKVIVQKWNGSEWKDVYSYISSDNRGVFLKVYNYINTMKSGSYRIQSILTVGSLYEQDETEVLSNYLYYKVLKNQIVSPNLKATYSPDGDIISSISGVVGAKYQWNGFAYDSVSIDATTLMLMFNDTLKVGSGKQIFVKATGDAKDINMTQFALDSSTELADVVDTVSLNGESYAPIYLPSGGYALTIEKATLNIEFGKVFDFDRGERPLIVKTNGSGKSGLVDYTFESITLDNYSSSIEDYLVSDGSSQFSIHGIKVLYQSTDVTENYEVKLSSGEFHIISEENSSKYSVSSYGITVKTQGEELNLENINMSGVGSFTFSFTIDNQEITLLESGEYSNSEGILLFLVKESENEYKVYVNKQNSQESKLKINVTYKINSSYSDIYQIIGSAKSEVTDLANISYKDASSMGIGKILGSSLSQTLSSINQNFYPVISDTTYIEIDSDNKTFVKKIYLKAGEEAYDIENIESGYIYAKLKYLGLKNISSESLEINTILQGSDYKTSLKLNKLIASVLLTPKWKFESFDDGYGVDYIPEINGQTYYAQPNGELVIDSQLIFGSSDSQRRQEMSVVMRSFEVRRTHYLGNLSGDNIKFYQIANENPDDRFVSTDLGGTWTATITYAYEGQEIVNTFNFNLNIDLQPWADFVMTDSTRVYNGQSTDEDTLLADVTLFQELVSQNMSLSEVEEKLRLSSTLLYSETQDGSRQEVQALKNAGVYTVKLSTKAGYANIWSFEEGETLEYTIIVSPYVITSGGWNFEKVMSSPDPEFVKDVQIFETGETIKITFSRESGENVGFYKFVSAQIDEENRINYAFAENLDLGGLTITEPVGGQYYISSLGGDLTTIYDGQNLADSELSLTYNRTENGKNIFTLGLSHNGQTSSIEVDMYYWNGDLNERIEIPSDSVLTAKFISASAGVGEYKIQVSVNAGASFTGERISVTILTKELSVTKVEKTFDGTTSISGAVVEIDGIVTGDTVYFSGEYESPLAGERKILNASVDNDNYSLNGEIIGLIQKATYASGDYQKSQLRNVDYGDLSQASTVQDLLTFISLDFTVNGIAKVVENSFAQIDAMTIDNSYISSAGFVKAGNVIVKITLSSDNFTDLNKPFEIELSVQKYGLNLSSVIIEKDYDGNYRNSDKSPTSAFPASLPSIDDYIFAGDKVSIASTGRYVITNGFLTGACQVENFTLEGEDSENYEVKTSAQGKINSYDVTINLEVDRPTFVDDGQEIKNIPSSYSFAYPFTSSNPIADIFNDIKNLAPTRVGYTAKWNYDRRGEVTIIALDSEFENEVISFAENDSREGKFIAYWTINTYILTLDYQSERASVTADKTEIEYYSDVVITSIANEGYKIGEITEEGLCESYSIYQSENTYKKTINKVKSDYLFKINYEQIAVTFVLNQNAPSVNGQVYGVDYQGSGKVVFAYSNLETLTKDSLIVYVLEKQGTFKHTEYSFKNLAGDKAFVGEKTLKEVLQMANDRVYEDCEVELNAEWEGEEYEIIFDLNSDGKITDPASIANLALRFGEEISALPTATMEGKEVKGWSINERRISQGQNLDIIGTKRGDKYYLTALALWDGSEFSLKIEKGENISRVLQNGSEVSADSEFILKYEDSELIFEVFANNGYSVGVDTTLFHGEVEQLEGQDGVFAVKNLTEDSVLKFIAIASDNALKIITSHCESIEVTDEVGNEVTENGGQYILKTGKTAYITINANQGYIFNEACFASLVLSGWGNVTAEEISGEKTIVLKWADFTGSATVEIHPTQRTNTIKVNANDMFESVSFDGGVTYISLSSSESGEILTEESKVVLFRLKYGYENPTIANHQFETFSTWNNEDKIFEMQATIANVTGDIEIDLSASERNYTFNLSVIDGAESFAIITTNRSQTIAFGENISLGVNVTSLAYAFVEWRIEDAVLSQKETDVIKIDESLKDILESLPHADETIISVYAVVEEVFTPISIEVQSKGQIKFNCTDILNISGDKKTIVVSENTPITQRLKISEELEIELIPEDGYHFDKFFINGGEVDFENNGFGARFEDDRIFVIISTEIGRMSFRFAPDEFNMSVKAVVEINHIQSQPTNEGGQIFLCDENGNKLSDYADGSVAEGYDFLVKTFTDANVYLLVEAKHGFNATVTAVNTKVSKVAGSEKEIYFVENIKNGAEVLATFTAKSNTITVQYVIDGTNQVVMAGKIVADTTSTLVQATTNNSYYVSVNALTTSTAKFEAFIGINYNLVLDGEKAKVKVVYADNRTDLSDFSEGNLIQRDYSLIGYTRSFEFSLKNIDSDATLYISVKPKIYNLRLFVDEGEEITITNGITFGYEFSLSSLTSEQLALMFKEKPNFDLGGYFTKQLGQGVNYINASGRVMKSWTESGYYFDGVYYKPTENFNEETNTFTLYAFWMYKKAYITIEFIPERLGKAEFQYTKLSEFVSSGFNESKGWMGEEDNFYAEIMAGKKLTFLSKEIRGYVFEKWIVSVGDTAVEFNSSSFSYQFDNLQYTVTAVYRPTVTLSVYCATNQKQEGGTFEIFQDGVKVDGSIDSQKSLTLVATPNEGYIFLYFVNTQTGSVYSAQSQTGGKYFFTLSKQDSLLSLRAVFKGDDVIISASLGEIISRHTLDGIYVNGIKQNVNLSGVTIRGHIGDEILLRVYKKIGYKIEESHGLFTPYIDAEGRICFVYKVKLSDLDLEGTMHKLNIIFTAPQESIEISITNGVEEDGRYISSSVGGKVTYVSGVVSEQIISTRKYEALFGDKLVFDISAFTNYKLAYFVVNGERADLTNYFSEGTLTINEAFMSNFYNDRSISVEVCFKAMIWADEDSRSEKLVGNGTKNSPYLISKASDFGFVAYAINNDLANERGLKYADAYYKVIKDVDFDGKFWSPIGELNPFNGIFDLGGYTFANINLDKSYTDPVTSYRGLFLHLTDKAVILQDKTGVYIIAGVVCGIVAIMIVAPIVIWIKRRKDSAYHF